MKSKSILVINTPKCCGKCDMRKYDGNDTWRCFKINRILDDIEKISSDCPLKPLPKKIARAFDIDKSFIDGYNYCLDEIIGGNDE